MTNVISSWVQSNGTRYLLQSNTTFYVDTVNGNDCNDGLSNTNAKKTIQSTIDQFYQQVDCGGQQPTIQVMDGSTITECISVFGQVPGARPEIFVRGNVTPGQYIPWNLTGNNQTAVQARDNGILTVEGFSFSAGSHTGCVFLNPSQQGTLDYNNIVFGPCLGGYHIFIDHGGSANCLDRSTGTSITGSAGSHILMGGVGASHSMGGATINISPGLTFYNFIQAAGLSMLNWSFNYFNGNVSGSKYSITCNAVFIENGTIIPGTGTTVNTGGQAI